MRTRYLVGYVRAENQTAKAFCATFHWSDHGLAAVRDFWIPLSVINDDDHDEIENACKGDLIEIGIAQWWVNQQMESE